MPNPYYVAPRSNLLAEPTRQAMQLLQMKQSAELGRQQLSQRERQFQAGQPVRELQAETAARGMGVAETQAGTARMRAEQAGLQIPITETDYGADSITMLKLGFQTQGIEAKKTFPKFLDVMQELAENPQITKRAAYQHYKQNWAAYKKMIQEDLGNAILKAESPMLKEKLLSIQRDIGADKTGVMVDQLMGATSQAIQAERFERQTKRMAAEPTLKTATPVTWTTATKQVSNRFGKQDAMGNIIVTPELQGMNRIAQKKLVELKKTGLEPLEAVNMSEDFARNVEGRYWEYLEAAKGRPEDTEKVKKQYRARYGYVPKRKPR